MSENSVVDRDGASQKKFGEYVSTYCDNMRAACKAMIAHVNDASDNITDPSAKPALESLKEFAEAILETLPTAQEFGEKQIQLGKIIMEAESYRFTR